MLLNTIKIAIENALETEEVHVLDPQSDLTHLQAIVVSKQFEGMPLIARHQCIMKALKEHFATTLHALQLKTYTPQEWERISS